MQQPTFSPISHTPPPPFQYYLWRQHPAPTVLHGFLPEIIATDGTSIRRMIALDRQILFQQFDDPALARPIINRIEFGANQGIPLVGYSMANASESIAILQTGTQQEPGWLAFTDSERQLRPDEHQSSSFASFYNNASSIRLLAGGSISWENREMHLHAALEQRANTHSQIANLPDITAHVIDWTLQATYLRNKTLTPVRLTRKTAPHQQPFHASNQRIETNFLIEPHIFREFSQNPTFQLWFHLRLDRSLFCLPEQWNSVWIAVKPTLKT